MKRFIAMIMMVVAMTALSALPAFAAPHGGGGGQSGTVNCKIDKNIVPVANVQVCIALGGVVVK